MTFDVLVEAIRFILPAYCANAAPVVFGGGKPLDLGKPFVNGRPIFGSNKTFKGFFSGLAVGAAISCIGGVLFRYDVLLGVTISLGALLGDLIGSFVKRRLGMAPGSPLPIVDQLDFVAGALLLSLAISPPSLIVALTIVAITPPIHLLTNWIAYALGLKEKPW